MNIERLESDFHRVISKVIQNELRDPNIGFITLTDVNISRDLSYCKIFYSTINQEGRKQNAKKALDRAKGFIKREISRSVKIRKMPELTFIYDEALDYGNKISKVIADINRKK